MASEESAVSSCPSNALLSLLAASPWGCLVLDGGLATELERRGADLRDPLLSAKCLLDSRGTDLLMQVHLDYFRAGADIGLSASYQATVEAFLSKGLSVPEAEDMLAKSVRVVREARDLFWREYCEHRNGPGSSTSEDGGKEVGRCRPLVGASVGSYGAVLADGSEFTGNYGPDMTLDKFVEFHRRRVQVLAAAGPDILAFETIPSLLEAQAVVKVLEEENPGIHAWLSFTSLDGKHVPRGDAIEACAALVENSPHLAAVGINCTSPVFVETLLRALRRATRKMIIVYPNSGETFDGETREWVGSAAVGEGVLQSWIPAWVAAGANVIGGCCRTTPETIGCIRTSVLNL